MSLCDRWHKLPSEVLAEPAGMLRMLKVAELGGLFEEQEGGSGWPAE